MSKDFHLQGNNCFIVPTPKEKITASGIIIPDAAADSFKLGPLADTGTVQAISSSVEFAPGFEFKKGDKVIFDRSLGYTIKINGVEGYITGVYTILAVID